MLLRGRFRKWLLGPLVDQCLRMIDSCQQSEMRVLTTISPVKSSAPARAIWSFDLPDYYLHALVVDRNLCAHSQYCIGADRVTSKVV
jgi:hypothetical protein